MNQSTEVGPDTIIDAAIEASVRNGVEALDPNERLIFLISETEVHKDGNDPFLDRYPPHWIQETARAFAAVEPSVVMCLMLKRRIPYGLLASRIGCLPDWLLRTRDV